jgi:hypothetical protein
MFCSNSITEHLLRGVAAALLLAVAFYFSTVYPLLAIPAVIGAFFLLRGCPMCWLIGLIGTITRPRATQQIKD